MTDAPPPLPMTVVSGYLGAGKTSLVNHMLRNADGRRLFVLINDFGEIAIDAELIETRDGDSLTLANGCVCCSLGGDLYRALDRVLARHPRPDRLIVEASGVAEPARIAEVAKAEPELANGGVIVLCDAETLVERIAEPLLTRALSEQIAAADILLLNKCDIVGNERLAELEALLQELNEGAEIHRADHAAVPLDLLFMPRVSEKKASPPQNGSHGALYESCCWNSNAVPKLEDVKQALSALPTGILRLKGLLVLDDGMAWEIQASGGPLKIAQREAPSGSRPGLRLVAIGLRGQFDGAEVERRFQHLEQIETVL